MQIVNWDIISQKLLLIKNKLVRAIIVFIFSFVLVNSVKTQTFFECKIRLLYSSKQINERSSNYFKIKSAEIDGKQIKITLKNKTKLLLSADTIWGYQIKEYGTFVRAYNGGLYDIEKIDNLILYSQRDYANDYRNHIYYFSWGLDSAINLINKSEVKRIFSKNECILNKLKSTKLWHYPTDWDDKNKTIRFMVWCKECNMLKVDSTDHDNHFRK